MNVLSLFDGMSCGQLALKKAGIEYRNYFASEVDKYAIKVSSENFPNMIHLGDVTKIDYSKLPKIDLLIGGSPCQGFSFAGKQLNFNDPRSALFFEYVKALKILNPKYFMLENVKMKKEYQDVISTLLGVQPIEINSSLVSAQNRRRLYWTNISSVAQPEDRKIYLKDIIEDGADMVQIIRGRGNNPGGVRGEDGKSIPLTSSSFEQNCFLDDREKAHCLDANYFKGGNLKQYFEKHRRQLVFSKDEMCHIGNADIKGNDSIKRVYHPNGKAPTLTTMGGGHREPKILQVNHDKRSGGKQPYMQDKVYNIDGKSPSLTAEFASRTNIEDYNFKWRKLTVLECKRLQTVPDNYIMNVSKTQVYKMLGNGWTVDVIAHILKNITL